MTNWPGKNEKRYLAGALNARTGRLTFVEADRKDKLKTLGFGGELAYDPQNTTGPKFKASGFPTMVILDKKGKNEKIADIASGLDKMEKKLPR